MLNSEPILSQENRGKRVVNAASATGPALSDANATANPGPVVNHAVAREFYDAVRPSAFILGYTQGRHITSTEEFQALTEEADVNTSIYFFTSRR